MDGEAAAIPANWLDIPVEQAIAQMGVEEAPLDDQFTELARDLSKELGYTALSQTPEYVQAQRRALATILEEADIKVFNLDGIKQYKDKKLDEMNAKFNHPDNAKLRRYTAIFNSMAIFSLVLGISFFFFGLNGWYLLSMMLMSLIIAGCISTEIPQADEEWAWRRSVLGGHNGYNEAMPQPILKNLMIIRKAANEADLPVRFEVDEIVRNDVWRKRQAVDPFISVRIPNDSTRFYFGVWDEPDFKGSYRIPS